MANPTMTTDEMLAMLQANEVLKTLKFSREGDIIKIKNSTGLKCATVTPVRDQWDGFIYQVSPSGKIIYDDGILGTPSTVRILLEVFFETPLIT